MWPPTSHSLAPSIYPFIRKMALTRICKRNPGTRSTVLVESHQSPVPLSLTPLCESYRCLCLFPLYKTRQPILGLSESFWGWHQISKNEQPFKIPPALIISSRSNLPPPLRNKAVYVLCKDSEAKTASSLSQTGILQEDRSECREVPCFTKARAEGEGRAEDLHMGLDSLRPGSPVCSYRAQRVIFIEPDGQK